MNPSERSDAKVAIGYHKLKWTGRKVKLKEKAERRRKSLATCFFFSGGSTYSVNTWRWMVIQWAAPTEHKNTHLSEEILLFALLLYLSPWCSRKCCLLSIRTRIKVAHPRVIYKMWELASSAASSMCSDSHFYNISGNCGTEAKRWSLSFQWWSTK